MSINVGKGKNNYCKECDTEYSLDMEKNAKKFSMLALTLSCGLILSGCTSTSQDTSKTSNVAPTETSSTSKAEGTEATEQSASSNSTSDQGQTEGNASQGVADPSQEAVSTPETTQQTVVSTVPVISIVLCRVSATNRKVTVAAESAASGGKKGISKVVLTRKNDENADLSVTLNFIGFETAKMNEWSTSSVPTGTNFGDKITITATATDGTTARLIQDVPCSIG